MFEQRQYQQEDIAYGVEHGPELRPIHCIATGGGKTFCQAMICKHEYDLGNASAIVTPREEIFTQTHATVSDIIGPENITKLMAGHQWRPYMPVHVISWDTLIARVKKSDHWYPDVKRLIVDEAHLSMAPRKLEILRRYAEQGITIDAYTATPARQTGKGLGAFYTNIKNVISIRELIKQGYLAPCEYWGAKQADLSGVRSSHGDYNIKDLGKAVVKRQGDVVDTWGRIASDKHTIVFAVDVADCEALAERFQQAGVAALSLHSKLHPEERRARVKAFKSGKAQVLVNVGIASYGFDDPSVDCVVLGRPTKSVVLWLQMIGRGMRPHPEKENCMVIDHTGGVRNPELGYAEDLRRWRLGKDATASTNWTVDARNPKKKDDEEKRFECEECHYIFASSLVCPKCGTHIPMPKQEAEFEDADIVRISRQRSDTVPEGWPAPFNAYCMFRHIAIERGYKIGWAAAQYKTRFGDWPPRDWNAPGNLMKPSVIVLNWVRSKQIAYAKSKKAANG